MKRFLTQRTVTQQPRLRTVSKLAMNRKLPQHKLRQAVPKVGTEIIIRAPITAQGQSLSGLGASISPSQEVTVTYGEPIIVSPGPSPMPGGTLFGNEPSALVQQESPVSAPAHIPGSSQDVCSPYTGTAVAGVLDEEKNVLFRWALILGGAFAFFKYTAVGRKWAVKIGLSEPKGA